MADHSAVILISQALFCSSGETVPQPGEEKPLLRKAKIRYTDSGAKNPAPLRSRNAKGGTG
ncbi:hypothetical protein HMPREF1986_00434 [Oribacterium sp. oral taxon 078 str. F0263]|nr:hypothetical protein HMPREF1986_00434 [Oribacterium sp. oral taxon 078 str. F0263]